jgi:hypothetical protein
MGISKHMLSKKPLILVLDIHVVDIMPPLAPDTCVVQPLFEFVLV